MCLKRIVGGACFGLLALALAAPALAQAPAPAERGKAELKAGPGAITLDYGRPSLKGRDMLTQLKEGDSWRMGRNEATVLTTPVDLAFGKTRIAKGAYSLFLKRTGDGFQLVFNSQTGQWGTEHDATKDVAGVAMTKADLPAPVETFTMALPAAPNGGAVELSWGAMKLTAPFEIAK